MCAAAANAAKPGHLLHSLPSACHPHIAIASPLQCKDPFHIAIMGYAGVMVAVYPVGIPALYAYLLFFKHGKEMRLLKSIEMKRVALIDDARAAAELSAAREGLQTSSTTPDLQESPDFTEEHDETAISFQHQVAHLKSEEERLRAELPDYVQKLVLGYDLRTYYFEIIECARKLAVTISCYCFSSSSSHSHRCSRPAGACASWPSSACPSSFSRLDLSAS